MRKSFAEWIRLKESGFRVSPSFTDPPDDRPAPPKVTIDDGIALDGSDKPPVRKKKKKCNCRHREGNGM